MLINLRNALMGGKRTPTAKDYVQDGLIAMWDGIENAGWGVHSDERIITNLVTGEQITIPENGYEIGADYIISDSNASLALGSLAGKISTPCTLTSVGCSMTRPSNTTYTTGYFGVHGIGGVFMWRYSSGATGIVGCLAYTSSGHIRYYGAPQNVQIAKAEANSEVFGVSRSRACVFNDLSTPSLALYCNGEEKAGLNTITYTDPWSSATYAATSPDGLSSRVKWSNLAIYSRALTASEIAANYAIDKARFGLP